MLQERFVGRAHELATLAGLLSALPRAGSRLVLVSGESGIGKSALCKQLAVRATAHGVRVAQGQVWEWGGAPPFWPWQQLLRGLHVLGDERLDALLGEPDGERSAGARFALFDALVARLRDEAQRAPLLLILEDVHAADVPSLLLLRFAAEQLRDAPVLLLATRRTLEAQPSAEAQPLLAELSRRALSIELRGLDLAELHELVGEHAAPLAARTGGNPLLVEALRDAPNGRALPEKARVVLAARLERLPSEARALLGPAAVLGEQLSAPLLSALCGLALPDLLAPLRVLSDARVLVEGAAGSLRFAHGLLHELAYTQLSPAERLSLHRAAGALLEAQGGSLAALARHFLAVTPEPQKAVQYAAAAGDQALAALAFEAAAGHYQSALAAAEGTAVQASLWTRLAEAQAASGATQAARDGFLRACISNDSTWLSRAALGLAKLAGFAGFDVEAVHWLERALEGDTSDDQRVPLWGALAGRCWMLPDGVARAEAATEQALALAERLGDPRLRAEALAESAVLGWVADGGQPIHRQRAQALRTLAGQLGDLTLQLEAQRWRFALGMVHGELAEARAALQLFEALAARAGRPQLRVQLLLRRFMLACLEGRHADADALPGALHQAAERAGDPQREFMLAGLALQRARANAGPALDDATGQLQRSASGYMHPDVVAAHVLWSDAQRGRLAQARDRLPALIDGVLQLPWIGRPVVLVACSWLVWLTGDRAQAARLLPLLAPFERLSLMGAAVEFFGTGTLYLGLCAAAAGDDVQAERWLTSAVAQLSQLAALPWLARAEYALATVLRSTRPAQAEQLAQLARARAEALGGLWLGEPVGVAPAPVAGSEGLFIHEGDAYAVALGDLQHVQRVRGGKGMAYLEQLLRGEGQELHVLSLVGAALDQGGDEPLLDAQAKQAYRARLEALREQQEEAEQHGDYARAERAGEELAALTRELARATGLGGRDRQGGTAERARASVTLAIRRAIKAIAAVQPELGAHLDRAVQTGTFCCYQPEPRARVRWRFAHVAS